MSSRAFAHALVRANAISLERVSWRKRRPSVSSRRVANSSAAVDVSRREPSFDTPQVLIWGACTRPALGWSRCQDGQPLGFSASSVWGISARFRLQIEMIPRYEQSFGSPQAQSSIREDQARSSITRTELEGSSLGSLGPCRAAALVEECQTGFHAEPGF